MAVSRGLLPYPLGLLVIVLLRGYFTSQMSLVSRSSAKLWYFLAAFTSSICSVTASSYVGASTSRITPRATGKPSPLPISASFSCSVLSGQCASCTRMSFSVMPSSPIFTTFSPKPSCTRPYSRSLPNTSGLPCST